MGTERDKKCKYLSDLRSDSLADNRQLLVTSASNPQNNMNNNNDIALSLKFSPEYVIIICKNDNYNVL